jgi:hypothetical protein
MLDWIMQGQDGIDAARIAELAKTNERLDTTVATPPQLRVAYLTAWPARNGVAAFRPDVYELDGTGFVVGQPLPVGEKLNGQRYVLKPIPRLQQDIDTNDGLGFASLFRRNDDVARPGQNRRNSDSLISLPSSNAKKDAQRLKAEKAKLAKKKADEKAKLAKKKADEKAKLAKKKADEKARLAKKKAAEKAKLARAEAKDAKTKKVVKKDSATAAAKKPDAKAAAATPKKDAKPKAAAKKAADCKPGSDGKLPAGCTAAAPKKPEAKPEKTAAATN